MTHAVQKGKQPKQLKSFKQFQQPRKRPESNGQIVETLHIDDRWTQFKIEGKNVLPRSNHVAVIYNQYLYIHGGYNTDKGVLQDLQVIDLQADHGFKWKQIESAGGPGKLRNHSAGVHKGDMVIFGGQNSKNQNSNLTWFYEFKGGNWRSQKPDIAVPCIDSHSSAIEGSRMYVFGGFVQEEAKYSNTLYCLDLENLKWSITSQLHNCKGKSPTAKANMSMVCFQGNLWVFGGRDSNSTFNDFWKYNLGKNQWTQVISINAPEPRRSHSMIVYEGQFWMFGGIQDVTKEKNDINIYTPSTQQWIKIMNTSNLVYECSPTMKSKSKGQGKERTSPKKSMSRNMNQISLISPTEGRKSSNGGQAMKRILQQNKHKKFLQRKNQLLKQFSSQQPATGRKSHSPITESMLKTLQLIGDQEPSRQILHGQIMYDPTNQYIVGKKPCARDAHSCVLYNDKMVIFGGDRHLMCFGDLYNFNLKKGIESKSLYQRHNVILHKG